MKKATLLLITLLVHPLSSLGGDSSEEFIKDQEKCKTLSYRGQEKKKTIGYGFVGMNRKSMTCQEATLILRSKLNEIRKVIKEEKISLSSTQQSALVSLIYNIGIPAFKDSRLLVFLKKGLHQKAALEFSSWTFVNGRQSKGLVTRRNKEKQLFLQQQHR